MHAYAGLFNNIGFPLIRFHLNVENFNAIPFSMYTIFRVHDALLENAGRPGAMPMPLHGNSVLILRTIKKDTTAKKDRFFRVECLLLTNHHFLDFQPR
jgi:hypothetical protein